MKIFLTNRTRIVFLALLIVGEGILIALYRIHHQRSLLGAAWLLGGNGFVFAPLLLWFDWLRRRGLFGCAWMTLAFIFLSFEWWAKKETLSAIAGTRIVVLGIVGFFWRLRFLDQFSRAERWASVTGELSQSWIQDGYQMVSYSYAVNGSYYSGMVSLGSVWQQLWERMLERFRRKRAPNLASVRGELKRRPVLIRYRADQPEVSILLKSDQADYLRDQLRRL